MGFLDFVKNKVGTSDKKGKNDEVQSYLLSARNNLKLASDHVHKFLDGVRDFQPAKRHEELYYNEVRQRLVAMRQGMHKGLALLDERMGNEINTMNPIKNTDQLKDMISQWIKSISTNDEKVYDILKILTVEMWAPEKITRGFPSPLNKDAVCGYLTSAVSYLAEAKNSLENYSAAKAVLDEED